MFTLEGMANICFDTDLLVFGSFLSSLKQFLGRGRERRGDKLCGIISDIVKKYCLETKNWENGPTDGLEAIFPPPSKHNNDFFKKRKA